MIRPRSSAVRPLWLLVGAVALALIALITWRVIDGGAEKEREAEREKPVAAPQRVSTADGATIVAVDLDDQRRNGLQTMPVAAATAPETVQAIAAVVDVTPYGMLAQSLLNARAQTATAQAKVEASKAAFQRAQLLYKDSQNMSLAQLQAAEATYQADAAGLAAAQTQATTAAATARLQFGPVLGASLDRRLGQDLIQRRTVLLQVTAPAGMAVARPPTTLTVRPDNGPAVFGRLVSAAVTTDPRIQGASFYYVAPAATGLLAGLNVTAELSTGAVRSGVVVPASAVIVWQGQSWVYQRTGPKTFKRVAIAVAGSGAGGAYVVTNLPPGAQVVTSGAQLLLSEEMRPQTSQAAGETD
ncbi:hypothetical protein [Phenylobacterium montanum]|uniref:hypothetical protein n=1 Tax=Phenylobacterium montanum TaxID=2823693 RepID=UPI002011A530|nr:hypothetical protein [Caulobacter sp. S6]